MQNHFLCLVLILLGCPTFLFAQKMDSQNQNAANFPTPEIAEILSKVETAPNYLKPIYYSELANKHLGLEKDSANLSASVAYAEMGLKKWRRLDKKELKKANQTGVNESSLRKLKNEIRAQIIQYAADKNTLDAYNLLFELFPKLPGKIHESATLARNKLVLDSVLALTDYKEIYAMQKRYGYDIQYYNPEFKNTIDSLVIHNYFNLFEEPSILNVLFFMREFPDLGVFVDEQLSKAFIKMPYIELVENFLQPYSSRSFPKTAKAIYQYYVASGEEQDLVLFAKKYPDFAQNDQYLNDYQIAKEGYFKLISDHEDHLSQFIQMAGPTHRSFFALQRMIRKNVEDQDWGAALEKVERHKIYFKEDARFLSLVEILSEDINPIEPTGLGNETINTILEEYSPVMTSDGKTLYFCRRGGEKENIFAAKRKEDHWTAPKPVEALNHPDLNEAPLAISPDGSTLLMFEEGVLKITEKTKSGWSTPTTFFPAELQSKWQGGTTISSDKKTIIFAARRADRVGIPKEENIDLYITHKNDSSWSFPKNLGLTLNTPFEERSPFLHPDMSTLYFSSNGHGGLGDLDVFKTTRVGEGWSNWSTPVNLGKSVNTTQKDWNYRVVTDGSTAYFSKEVTNRQEELYQIGLPPKHRPNQVSTVNGQLTDLEGLPIQANLLVEDLETGLVIKSIQPDPEDGTFFITLPSGKLYGYSVESDFYFPLSGHIDLRSQDSIVHVSHTIKTPPIDQLTDSGIGIILKNLFFEHDKAIIQPTSYNELDRLAQFLKKVNFQVEIAGHTDNTGTEAYNLTLSQKRAEAVKAYLNQKGCPNELIATKGYGLSQPMVSNNTLEGRAQNRRVEIRFMDSKEEK